METWVEELPKKKFFPRVNSEECLVTISMLISNRIDTVEKCFESFRPLLEQIPSEFIAVDTVGDEKSDGSLDIARRYADKIVHFEWCDDFAAARNAGLKEARGKWLIYLDDDEWFDNIGPLIEFFSKPELYNNCNRVFMMEHSYTTNAQIDYGESKFGRISAIVPDSRFVNPVHEVLEGVSYENEYELKGTFVHHVGYCGKYSVGKAQRNNRIMDKELKDKPGNLHLWLQRIAGSSKKKEDLLKITEKAFKTLSELHLEKWNEFEWVEIFLYRMSAYTLCRMWNELAESTGEFVRNVINPFYLGVVSKYNLVRNFEEFDADDALKWLKMYFKAVSYGEKHDDMKFLGFFSNEVTRGMMYRVFLNYLEECGKNCDDSYERIKGVVLDVPWNLYDSGRKDALAYVLKEVINEDDVETIRKLSDKFSQVDDVNAITEFMEQLDRIRLNLESETAVDSFMRVVSALELDNDTLWLMQHLDDEVSQKQLDENLSPDISAAVPNECLIELCVSNGISPQKYVENMSWEDFTKTVSALLFKAERHIDVIPDFAERIEESWEPSAYRNYLLANLRRRYIFQNTMLFSKVMSESESYCRNMIDFAGEVYSEKLCEIVSPMLPAEIRFAIVFGRALEFRRSGMVQESLECLKQALDIFKYSETLVKRIIQEISLEQRRHTAVSDELVRLGNQVKAQITVLISQGQIEVAKSLLDELKQITPDDGDIVTLEKLCR